jgi:hypothetical protein
MQAGLLVQATGVWLHWPPLNCMQASTVQGLLSSQFTGVPQTPFAHVFPTVQPPNTEQVAVLLVCTQLPVAVSQESSVQGLLSLQFLAVLTQAPVALVQESTVQGLLSSQFFAVPVQAPLTHVSPEVQALLSLQANPSLIEV